MLYGEYNHQVDAKGRIRLPAKFKPTLGNGSLITKGQSGCLFVFSETTVEDLRHKTKDIPLGDVAAQAAVRALFSSAYEVEEDPQGRFVLPQKLREYAGIDKNIVFIGAGDRAEIWSEEKWSEMNTAASFDDALDKISKYGI